MKRRRVSKNKSGMLVESYAVSMHGTRVGSLQRRGDHTQFVISPEYAANPDRPVLGLRIEQSSPRELSAAMRLPAWFSNLLPEGLLREWIARERKVSPARGMELLAQVGHDLPGAVVVTREDGAPEGWIEADRVADRSGSEASGPLKFSLAGVGLKFSMLQLGDRLTLPARGTDGDWIVKLPDHLHPNVPRNELAMMELARRVGIDVPETRLYERADLDDLPDMAWPNAETEAYAVRRFDRVPGGRIHIEDLAQVRGFYPDNKYSGTFETVAANLFRRRDVEALEEFVRRLTLIIMIGNGDAHLKNWSLIYRDRRVPTLSPAYDLVSTYPYCGSSEDLGLKLDQTRRFERISLGSFERLQERLGAPGTRLAEIAEDAARRIEIEWPKCGKILAGCGKLADEIGVHVDRLGRQLSKR